MPGEQDLNIGQKFIYDQIMAQISDLKEDFKEMRRDLAHLTALQSAATNQEIKLMTEHEVCRVQVQDHEKAIKELQKFKIQIVTIAATVQIISVLVIHFLEKALQTAGPIITK